MYQGCSLSNKIEYVLPSIEKNEEINTHKQPEGAQIKH